MRKIRIDKNTSITGDVIKWVISKHKAEKDRIAELMNYYNNNNTAINNRSYDDNKPSNKLSHPFASYITNMAVGYFLGKPISYNSNNSNLLSRINEDYSDAGYEAYFIFDADNLLDKNYIKEMNKAYDSGVKICTSFRDSKNFGDSWVSANSSMMFYMECTMTHQTRTKNNIGTYVSGTGYYVDANIIKENGGWIHHLIIEDVEFSVDSAIKGYKTMYCADAIFYDEQPIKLKDSYTQRLRWAKGGHQCFGKYVWSLLKRVFTGKNKMTCCGLLIHVCPVPVIAFFWTVLYSVVAFIEGIVIDNSIYAGLYNVLTKGILIIGIFAIFFLFYTIVIMAKNHKRMNVSIYKKIWYSFTYPFYMVVFLIASVVSLFAKVTWKAIPHVSDKSIEEVVKE